MTFAGSLLSLVSAACEKSTKQAWYSPIPKSIECCWTSFSDSFPTYFWCFYCEYFRLFNSSTLNYVIFTTLLDMYYYLLFHNYMPRWSHCTYSQIFCYRIFDYDMLCHNSGCLHQVSYSEIVPQHTQHESFLTLIFSQCFSCCEIFNGRLIENFQ